MTSTSAPSLSESAANITLLCKLMLLLFAIIVSLFEEDFLELLPGICGCANLLGETQSLPCQTASQSLLL
jgi:hypothetical protein